MLGGSIVGRHAAELISVIALAVTANLRVSDIMESLLVHPALSEALAEALIRRSPGDQSITATTSPPPTLSPPRP